MTTIDRLNYVGNGISRDVSRKVRLLHEITPWYPLKTNRRCSAIALIVCIIITIAVIPCTEARESSRLVIGFTGSAFQDVTNTDIKAAVSVLIQKVAFKYFDKGESHFYDNLPEMAADLKRGKTHVLAMPVEEFMELRKLSPIDPILVTSSSGSFDTELLLLVRKDSGFHSIHDLRNKTIAVPPRNPRYCPLYQVWLETLLVKEGFIDMDKYFSVIKEAKNTSKAIMPVFFRQADACTVTRQVLDLTTELNPQISKELTVIARMGKLGQGIIAVDRKLPEKNKEKIRQAFLTLHQTPDGEQLLMLFKVKKLIPIPSGYLRETEALYSRHPIHKQRISNNELVTRKRP